MFRIARKIRVGRETGNTHIFFLGLTNVLEICLDLYILNQSQQSLILI